MEGGRAHGASASSEFPSIKQLKEEGKLFSPAVQSLARCLCSSKPSLKTLAGSHTRHEDGTHWEVGRDGYGRQRGTVKR